MGFPLERGSIEDGILTCHWHHARFDLESGRTFDLWADDVPTFLIELRDGEVWVPPRATPIPPRTGVSGFRTASHMTLVSSSPRPCMVSSRPTYRRPTLSARWRCSAR
jgi:hypothetical protein